MLLHHLREHIRDKSVKKAKILVSKYTKVLPLCSQLPASTQPHAFQLPFQIQPFWPKAALQPGAEQWPRLGSLSCSVIREFSFPSLGITTCSLALPRAARCRWTPRQQTRGTNCVARRHQEGLSLLPLCLWTPRLSPPPQFHTSLAPRPPAASSSCTSASAGDILTTRSRLGRFYFHWYQSWFIFSLVKYKVTFRYLTTRTET